VQLQNNSGALAKLYEPCRYVTFARTGDIYCLFYEQGYNLLKNGGLVCFITSNKWMRAGYGENIRKFFIENTNPDQLIDFVGVKVFESATVDPNILLFTKEKNKEKTKSCIIKNHDTKELSVFVRQNTTTCKFHSADSWVILSPIEQRIKAKIEAVGTPLKDWDIQINYGIKTGFNDAFIIDGKKKDELITQDPKSEEIIRPILRGRDIKRYGYEFADLWLILATRDIVNTDIPNKYPAICKHLEQYKGKGKLGDNSTTKVFKRPWWSLMQEPTGYWEDFYKHKIIYPGLMRIAKSNSINFPRFALDTKRNFFFGNDCYFIVGKNIEYLWLILNSSLLGYLFKYYIYSFDETGFKIFTDYFQDIPIPIPNEKILKDVRNHISKGINVDSINKWIYQLFDFNYEEISEIENFVKKLLNETAR
jgi:type II restriction/modification system DNA methylase subunit YeeA